MSNPIEHNPSPKRKSDFKFLPELITVIVALISFYFTIPAINLMSQELYSYLIFVLIVYTVLKMPKLFGSIRINTENGFKLNLKEFSLRLWPIYTIFALIAFSFLGQLIATPIIRSDDYKNLLEIETGDFAQDVQNVDYSKIPLLDKTSAAMLGNRKLGELSDMVSQYEVADDYVQINYNQVPVRVTPLVYGDFFKWFANRDVGIPAYLIIDMIDQGVEVVRLEEGIKYSDSEPFGRNTMRYLRFKYPTYIFDDARFEIDESGVPYWVVPRLERNIGLFSGSDVQGAVLLNAVTGETQYYPVEEIPTWVDRVYAADLILQQYDYYGKYQNGFFNTIFSQRGMTMTTDGYNYLAMNDDVYVYTGITSVGSDESNIGFILSNQRTKETKFYAISGAEEFSAMDSAEGVVQHLGYNATFPLLINVNGQPTYIMALKDNAQLVKMYAMVNVSSYQIVATGETISETEKRYNERMSGEGVELDESSKATKSGTVEEIRSYVLDGNTIVLVKLIGDSTFYQFEPSNDEISVLLNQGDVISFSYYAYADFTPIIEASELAMG